MKKNTSPQSSIRNPQFFLRILAFIMPLIIFISFMFLFWRGLHENPTIIPTPLLNKPLPSFSMEALYYDPPMKIKNQDFLGHLTLLNVWASWCMTCQTEHHELMAIAKSKKIYIYGLNYKDTRENAQQWLKRNDNPYYLIIYDPKGELAINLGVYGTPETFLIDQNGIIRYKYIGPLTEEVWQNDLLPRIDKLSLK